MSIIEQELSRIMCKYLILLWKLFVEEFLFLIDPVWDSSPALTMTDFGQTHYLKISLNNNMYTHTSLLSVSSIIMPGWAGASKNNLASEILQSTKKI